MILQREIPYDVEVPRRLPGVAPFEMRDWLHVDEAYAGQIAERLRLLRERRGAVLALDEGARPAAEELLDLVLAWLPEGFVRDGDAVSCPDGRRVVVNRGDPLGTLGALVQEDLCLMETRGEQHVLTGAVLCFPASWRLDQKFLRPLTGIHEPVGEYDAGLAARVQRLFDGVQVGRPLWRFNVLTYADAELHQPRAEHEKRPEVNPRAAHFLRSERQCLIRLPRTRAVVFSIHTYLVDRAGEEP
ncbi:heme-dependent oxidative N-demethylase family protein [Sagittula sp. S175]|uniref:heme-dependent oxidative N-demethylase family protein n=1 Tax=Sagittula sp. S175 TaxID=3415129 RepID=UPI003C7BF640